MKKINRRIFLRNAGLLTASLAAQTYPGFSSVSKFGEWSKPNGRVAGNMTADETRYSFIPQDHGRALVNPQMGWTMHFYSNILNNYGSRLAPSDTVDDFPGLSTVYLRVPWAFVEPEEGKFVWELLDTPAQRWKDKGKYVAFRISATESWLYHATPHWVFEAGAKGYDIDGNIFEPDYDDPVFLEKVEKFIQVMASRYDCDPRVVFVDIGHFGMWGEGHTVMTTPKHGHEWGLDVQKKHIDIYCRHFKHTQLCISDDYAGHDKRGERFPITDYAFSQGVTIRDDSILVQPYPNHWYHSEMARLFWPTLPVILEHEHYNGSVEKKAWDKELLLQSIEEYHASYMSIHWWPRILLEENRDIIDRINRRMGYRLQLNRISWPRSVKMGEPFTIQSAWSNTGVAPCYSGGYPCFTLKDDEGGIVSVLTEAGNVRDLKVAEAGKAVPASFSSVFRIAPRYTDRTGTFFRSCHPGTYKLYVSVGDKNGTPRFELPYDGNDGHRRYYIGDMNITE